MPDAPAPKSHIVAIPRYVSGKSAESAMAEHGIQTAVKLASNECPFPPLPGVVEAITAAMTGSNRYFEHPAYELAATFAGRVGVSAEQVAVGAGSVALLEQIALAYTGPGDEVLFPWPSFIAYPQFTQLAGATPVNPPLVQETIDVDLLLAGLTERTSLVLIANPNNPSSTALRTAELQRLVDGIPSTCLVVIDEAYHEFVTGADVPNALALFGDRANVAILRTMSKAHGLAALRVGFMIAHPDVVAAIDACLIPFNVNGAAQAGAFAAFEHDDEVARRCAIITAERDSVAQHLRRHGLGIPASQGNFWWLPGGDRSMDIGLALEKRGVVTRPSPAGVRVTVGFPHENVRFLEALQDAFVAEPGLGEDWRLLSGNRAPCAADLIDRLSVVAETPAADRLGARIASLSAAQWDECQNELVDDVAQLETAQ